MTLARFLRWADPVEGSAYLREFEGRAEQRLSAALASVGACSAELAGTLVDLAAALPAASVLRVARAPELEYQLRRSRSPGGSVEELGLFLARAFEAELLLSAEGLARAGDAPLWTAIGDVVLPGGRPSRAAGEGPALDTASPYNRGDVARRFERHAAIEADQEDRLRADLDEAMALLGRGAPIAAGFTRAFTTVVVPLRVEGFQSHFGSFSSSWYPGRTVLVNPDAPEMGLHQRAAALLHEAIHSLIDVSEIGGQLLIEGASPPRPVRSPWTGAEISLQSLLDAYCVWYGLLWFWRQAEARQAADPAACASLARACARGFAPEPAQVFGELLPCVHPAALATVETLRRAIA